jgi:hypothetical protein
MSGDAFPVGFSDIVAQAVHHGTVYEAREPVSEDLWGQLPEGLHVYTACRAREKLLRHFEAQLGEDFAPEAIRFSLREGGEEKLLPLELHQAVVDRYR